MQHRFRRHDSSGLASQLVFVGGWVGGLVVKGGAVAAGVARVGWVVSMHTACSPLFNIYIYIYIYILVYVVTSPIWAAFPICFTAFYGRTHV